MFFHFHAFFYAIVFAGMLESSIFFSLSKTESMRDNWVFYLPLATVFFTLFAVRKIGKNLKLSIIPIIFSIASMLLLYLIDSVPEKNVFIALAFMIYYLSLIGIFRLKEYANDQTARGMISASAMTAIFFFYSSFYGLYLNFSIPLWILMLAFLVVTVAVSFEYLSILDDRRQRIWTYSLILGMIMSEIAWVINFWPFGYLTTAAVCLIIYYIMWDLVVTYFVNNLSQKRLAANLIFFGFIITIVLATSRWMPVV